MATRTTAAVPGVFLAALLCLAAPIAAHGTECNRAMASPVVHVALPGSPFAALPSTDGCWVFVSLTAGSGAAHAGVAVLGRADGAVTLVRTASLPGMPQGMTLTHDGTLLIAAIGPRVVFLDIRRLTSGAGDPVLGYWGEGHGWPMSVYVSVTADDRYLLVSNETVGTISVIDLAQTRRSRFAHVPLVGSIHVGSRPVGLAFSSDERFLFVTVESLSAIGWSNVCGREGDPTAVADHPEGAIVVIDMKLAVSSPDKSILRRVPAGCDPVRVVVSRETGRVYVTARGSNELLEFSEQALTGSGPTPRARALTVGASPVGVAVIDNGRKIVVANTDRFNTGAAAPSLYVIDRTRITGSSTPVSGVIPSRGFPREIRVTADGRTLLVTNYSAGTLQIVDLSGAPWDFANAKQSKPLLEPTLTAALTLDTPAREQGGRGLEGSCTGPAALRAVTRREARGSGLLM
jgi:DNA-binding beta-propeller fold protein YncE